MNIYTLINIISNCTIAFSAAALLIHIFGDPDNDIWDNKIKAYLAKFGLAVTTCGAISNVLTLSTPNKTEILLNVGMSITFFWLSWWQWEQFQEMKQAARQRAIEAAKKRAQTKTKVSKTRTKPASNRRKG
jgi:flagellar biosynthesis component FlhA